MNYTNNNFEKNTYLNVYDITKLKKTYIKTDNNKFLKSFDTCFNKNLNDNKKKNN
jgi:hypothetical protein